MTGPETDHALDTAVIAARKGGQIAKARLGKPGYVKWKGKRDVVSEASLEVQEVIVSTILAEFPDAGILAKEGPDDVILPVDAPHLWIVDPVCGSLNHIQGIPYFGVSVALRTEGQITVAAVYDPCRDELFRATRQTPAMMNEDKIVVGQIFEGSEAWESAVVGTDWPHDGERRDQTRLILGLIADQINECNLMGSPVLSLMNVAAGRLHAYWHLDLKIWDVAAASLILERAGAILTDAEGLSWLYSDGGYIASNDVIHGSLLNCIQSVRSFPAAGSGARGSHPKR